MVPGVQDDAIFALLGVGALNVLIIAGIARALQIVLGQATIIAMMVIFVFLNFPSAGGAIPAQRLPAFWRVLHSFWVSAPAVDAARAGPADLPQACTNAQRRRAPRARHRAGPRVGSHAVFQ